MEQIEAQVADLKILTPAGEPVRLGSLWVERPLLLVLMRHFGCIFCKEHIARLREILPEVRAMGVDVAVIGNGTPFMAQAFVEDYAFDVPVFTNPERDVYQALGAKRPSWAFILNPRFYVNSLRVLSKGHRQGKTQGDKAQLGGVFIVLPGGVMPYAHRSEIAGDIPGNDRVLRELRGVLAASR